jgi:DtxR family Mn-dependent transcriptional regulator
LLKKFLHQILGIDEKTAEQDACKIEHYLSKETLERIIKFINFIETCPQGEPEWLNNFYYFVKHKKKPPECKAKFLGGNLQNKTVKLSDLKIGTKGKILKITDTGVLKSKLLGLGFVKGEIVKIEKIAPLGSPIDVLIKNTHISLRKEEADKVIVEVL